MATLNRALLIGNVGNEPEVRYLDRDGNGNAKVATFRLATTERYTDRNGEQHENTEWHQIAAWNKVADVVEKLVHKGSQLYIEGMIKTRKWKDQDGKDRYTTEIQANGIQILGKREEAKPAPAEESPALRQLKAKVEDDNPEQDLPF